MLAFSSEHYAGRKIVEERAIHDTLGIMHELGFVLYQEGENNLYKSHSDFSFLFFVFIHMLLLGQCENNTF